MALEKTYLYSDDKNISMQNIYDYLIENAVPEYFDRVSFDETDYTISCYVGDLEFVRIKDSTYSNASQPGITINTINYSCEIHKGSSGKHICYAFKTSHGISFSTGYSDLTSVFTICKDNDGNTTAIVVSDLKINKSINKTSTSDVSKLFTANLQTGIIKGMHFWVCDDGLSTTATVPLYVGDTTNYTPDVLLLAYAQNVSDGILDIDGVKYWSNGLWAVKIDD